MIFFKKKTKWDLKEFCSQNYSAEMLMTSTYNELVLKQLTKVDNTFTTIDLDKFNVELLAIRFELFSLAWFQQFGDYSAILLAIFTKEYLYANGKAHIWEAAGQYSNAISASAFYGIDYSTIEGKMQDLSIKKKRLEQFSKYYVEGMDGKCIARAINKVGTKGNDRELLITSQYLSIDLGKILNFPFNDEATIFLISFFKELYDGNIQILKGIKIIS